MSRMIFAIIAALAGVYFGVQPAKARLMKPLRAR